MNNIFGFDIEAVPLGIYHPNAKLLCASLAQDPLVIMYARDHIQTNILNPEVNLFNLAVIGTIFKDPENIIVGHNINFDVMGWERFYQESFYQEGKNIYDNADINNRAIKCRLFDTMLASYLVDPGNPNSLSYVSQRFLGANKLDLSHKEIPNSPIERLLFYNAIDSMLVCRLYEPLMNEIIDNGYEKLFDYLTQAASVLLKMQIRGVRLDLDYITKHTKEVEDKLEEVHRVITEFFGEINFNSWQQMGAILYDKLDLPILKRSSTGNPSTDAETIIKLRNHPGVPKKIKKKLEIYTDYKKLTKLHGTYLIKLSTEHLGYDGNVHSQYFIGKGYDAGKSFGTITGRTSSSNPNNQNMPNIKTINGLEVNIRKAYIPREGYLFYKADYSQVEMRVAAFLSGDENMLRVFREGIDIHTYSLSGVFDTDYQYIVDEIKNKNPDWIQKRLMIKNFNFALIYGASPMKLQMMLLNQLEMDMDIEKVKKIVWLWNRMYPKFKEFKNIVHEIISTNGEVVTETGRRRVFFSEEERPTTYKEMSKCLLEGLNNLVQSLASDICVFGFIELDKQLGTVGGYPLFLVHDNADGEYPESVKGKEIKKICREAMIEHPKRVLMEDFLIDTTHLYLDVDVKTDLTHWS